MRLIVSGAGLVCKGGWWDSVGGSSMRASSGACISVVSPPSGSIRRMEGFVEIIALCEQSFAFGTQMCTCRRTIV
jgi:hypothetical protein